MGRAQILGGRARVESIGSIRSRNVTRLRAKRDRRAHSGGRIKRHIGREEVGRQARHLSLQAGETLGKIIHLLGKFIHLSLGGVDGSGGSRGNRRRSGSHV